MKLPSQIKMCLNEAYCRVRVGKNLPDMFPIKNGLKHGVASKFLLFNFALDYTIRMLQVNQDGLKLNRTHQVLVYADDDNILGESVHNIEENTQALVVVTKDAGLLQNEGKSWSEFYRFVNRRKGNRENIPAIKDCNGRLITDLVDKANHLNNYYYCHQLRVGQPG
jgi:hypothetical protein